MSNTNDTQLINITNFDTSKIVFSDPIAGSVPGDGPAIKFQRINLSVRNSDGSIGELIIPTSRLFSFGVSENKSQETGKVNGWTFPLCLWDKDGATKAQKEWTDTFDAIVETCISHILNTKEELDKYDLEKSDLKKFNPLYWKKEKKMVNGKSVLAVVDGTGPTLYTKLIYSKKNEKFVTKMYDQDDNLCDPLEMMGKYCYTNAAVKIESIFIGTKISLQVKLYEATVEPAQSGMKRLLMARPATDSKVTSSIVSPMNTLTVDADDVDDDSDGEGSIDMESTASTPITKKKVVVRRVFKK